MRIGITGATGFIGTQLLGFLIKNTDHEITAVARTLPGPGTLASNDQVKWIQGDLASRPTCDQLISEAEVVLHLAHTNTPLNSNRDLPGDAQINLIPTLNLLESIRSSGKKPHLVFASSGGAVYGRSEERVPFNEDKPCFPISSYGIQKLMIEHYLRMWSEEGHLTASVLRISNPYGTLLPTERMQGLIGIAVSRILSGRPVQVFGNPLNVRDYISLSDICHAFECVLQPRRPFSIYNIGSGTGLNVLEILKVIGEQTGRTISHELIEVPDANRLPPWVVLDISKARADLNWAPKIDITEGIRAILSK